MTSENITTLGPVAGKRASGAYFYTEMIEGVLA